MGSACRCTSFQVPASGSKNHGDSQNGWGDIGSAANPGHRRLPAALGEFQRRARPFPRHVALTMLPPGAAWKRLKDVENVVARQAYSGRVRGSPKCAKRLRSPNHVTADTRSSRSVSTIMA